MRGGRARRETRAAGRSDQVTKIAVTCRHQDSGPDCLQPLSDVWRGCMLTVIDLHKTEGKY